MRPIQKLAADRAAFLIRLLSGVRSHRSTIRVGLITLTLVLLAGLAQQASTRAIPPADPTSPPSILPASVGEGIATTDPVQLAFDTPVDTASVGDSLEIEPMAAVSLSWSDDRREVEVSPRLRWRTDTRYVITVPGEALQADGRPIGETSQFSFTTQTAPAVLEFLVIPAGTDALAMTGILNEVRSGAEEAATFEGGTVPATYADVSGLTQVMIRFDRPMDRAEVEASFVASPSIEGTFSWAGELLTFRPLGRLDAEARYTVSLVGARDRIGNPIDEDAVFSFSVRPEAQLVKIRPGLNATGVTDTKQVTLWFSQPLDPATVDDRFALVDLSSGSTVPGSLAWNETDTSLSFTPDTALAKGHQFETRLTAGTADADGNPVEGAWRFTTAASQSAPGAGPFIPAPAPSGDVVTYALNQVNAARAAYGFAPVWLDPAISAVAYAHSLDMLRNNYFSHYSLDGSGPGDRLRRGGISFSTFGENICRNGSGDQYGALNHCHAYFMAEPYPGYWNHKANILNPKFTRVGIGIAQSGSTMTLTWDFAT